MASFFEYCSKLSATIVFLLFLCQSIAATYRPSPWKWAHATFYGDETASGTMGGACGYGNLFVSGYGTDTAAISQSLFVNGFGCGICYQVKCTGTPACNKNVLFTTITVTNLSPPDWDVATDNIGRWNLNPSKVHFDLSKPAFMKIADWKAGIIPIVYRRVPCIRSGGLKFSFEGNPSWLLVYVMNVGGAGDIVNVWVKGSRTGWIKMSHNWGASYSGFANLGGQSLSFKVQSYTTKEIVVANNVAPPNWQVGRTYNSYVNLH